MTKCLEINPTVGFMPTTLLYCAGDTIEPSVSQKSVANLVLKGSCTSLPTAAQQSPTDGATALPLELQSLA